MHVWAEEVPHIKKFHAYQTLRMCKYTPVFTLAANEVDLSGSTKSYLVGVLSRL